MRTAQPPGDDVDLVHAARDGSTAALGELYRRHAAAVHGLALRLLGSRDDAEDVLQDVFVGLPRALRHYRERGRFEAWLKRLVVRTVLMRLRATRRKRETRLEEVGMVGGRTIQHPVDRIEAQRAIAGLPEQFRIVFVLREVEGYSHAEIAELLAISAGNSATRLSRAWSLLRAEVER